MKTLVRVAAGAATLVAVHLAGAQTPADTPDEPAPESAAPSAPSSSAPSSSAPAPSAPAPSEPPPSAPATSAPATSGTPFTVRPFASIVGGVKLDTVIQGPKDDREGRVSAISLADFGLRGTVGRWFSFQSELLVGGGGEGDPNYLPGFELHGSSAWLGQAQLQIRQQLVRFADGRWMAEVGRVVDEASVDFVSAHVGDTLYQDTATVYPFLYSGFLLGNGIRGTVQLVPGLRLGLAFLAGNPVSETGSLQVGGSFPPFNRFYIQPYQQVKQNSDNAPDDTFHMMLFAPSALYDGDVLQMRAEFQGYTVDTNTNSTADQPIHGYNLRGTARLKLLGDVISPFGGVALDRNDTVDPTNTARLAPDKYTSITWGAGVDFNYAHSTPTHPDGIGAQYDRVQYQVGAGPVTNIQFLNVGTTYWLNSWIAVGARLAVWVLSPVAPPLSPSSSGTSAPAPSAPHDQGEMSGLATLRMEL